MPSSHPRAAMWTAAWLAGCLLLAGCAGIPETSAPRIIEAVPSTGVTEEPDVRFQPRPPQPGQTAEQVVKGFLEAEGSPERQHGVARQFLTPSAATKWRDDAGVVVLAPTPEVVQEAGGARVSLSGKQVASLDPVGSYTPASGDGLPYRSRLQLVRVEGEWRIVNPPPGVILTAPTFYQAYRRLNVYFLARKETRVAPDPRWFAASHDALPNLLLKALLDGPAGSLADAVTTELANHVSLTSNVVPETDRVRVFLSGLAGLGATGQAAASAQIIWTLSQLGLPHIEIYNDGQPLVPQAVGGESFDWRTYDPDSLSLSSPCYIVRNGAVWTTEGKPTPGPAGGGSYAALSVGASPDLARLAVVGRVPRGMALYRGPIRGPLSARLDALSLSPPSWDPLTDQVWTVRNHTDIVEVPSRGPVMLVRVPELDRTQRIGQLRLSRDGSRAALTVGPAGHQVLYLGTVSASGSVLTGLRSIAPGLSNVVDIAWASADSLVVLNAGRAGAATMYSMGVDGSLSQMLTSYGLPKAPTALAAAPGQSTVVAADGGIWSLRDPRAGWTGVLPPGSVALEAPAYPG